MDGSYLKQLWSENRKLIYILSSFTLLLIIFLIMVLQIKENAYNVTKIKENELRIMTVVEPAQESKMDVTQYLDDLHAVIREKYGDRLEGYEIATGKLLDDGTWYVTTIEKPLEDQWSLPSDKYRIILHKNSDSWQIVAEPNLIFVYADYPEIPKGVIKSVNSL